MKRDLTSARNYHHAKKQRERSKRIDNNQGALSLQTKEGASVYIWKDGNHEDAVLITVSTIDHHRNEVRLSFNGSDNYEIYRESLISQADS
jgi:hypothetical protein